MFLITVIGCILGSFTANTKNLLLLDVFNTLGRNHSETKMINDIDIESYANINSTNILTENNWNQSSINKKVVFLTGCTGVMGKAALDEMVQYLDQLKLKVLVRPSLANHKFMEKYLKKYNNPKEQNIEVIWGDLVNYEDILRGVSHSDYVLHVGGLVSPVADDFPYLTQKTNIESAHNIVKAVLSQKNHENIKVCYIGSVAETGNRNYPIHWGRTGDPIKVSIYDHYGLSKVIAEQVFVESGLKNWVVLRQSGIIHPGIFKNMNPIIFNVPMNGVLEWCTYEDSGRLMRNLVLDDKNGNLPSEFWNHFYNIGSGEEYRMTNFEFYDMMFQKSGLGTIKNAFNPNWFATRNFHGHYYIDSDILEDYLHFRENYPLDHYFDRLLSKALFIYRIPKYIPFKKTLSFFIKIFMKTIANTKSLGSLDWIQQKNLARISSFFGSLDSYNQIPSNWEEFKLNKYNTSLEDGMKRKLNHGYDETKSEQELSIDDMREAAKYRGGELVSQSMIVGDMRTKLQWRCGHCGHIFEASPALILLGGHWCPHCYLPHAKWDYDSIARTNPFFAQVWYHDHDHHENNTYEFEELFKDDCYEHSHHTLKRIHYPF